MPFTKITEADLQGKGVQGQPDVPGLPAAEMQRKVEEIVREVTNVAFNRLVEELLADTAAENIGAKLDGMSAGRTLQAVLAELNTRQNTHAQKTDNPHAVTAAQAGAYTKQETDDAIDKKVQAIGAADMSKAEYGGSEPGVVARSDVAYSLSAEYLAQIFPRMQLAEQETPYTWYDGKPIYRKCGLVMSTDMRYEEKKSTVWGATGNKEATLKWFYLENWIGGVDKIVSLTACWYLPGGDGDFYMPLSAKRNGMSDYGGCVTGSVKNGSVEVILELGERPLSDTPTHGFIIDCQFTKK